jgi:hypothetical protein
METNQNKVQPPQKTQEEMIAEIYKFTKQTRNYMRWQMYITLVLVVLPLLASLFILPFAIKSITNTYLPSIQSVDSSQSSGSSQSIQGLLKGLQ